MKVYLIVFITLCHHLSNAQAPVKQLKASLFDGKTFKGWEGDTVHTWRVENSTIIGGNLRQTVPHNEFLATVDSYEDFELHMQFKLIGTGFVNAGVQFHSQRVKDPAFEMTGYQADLGDGYWASLYDESRRNVTIVKPDTALIDKSLYRDNWNTYTIRSEGRRIRIWLNNVQTVDYTEPDEKIGHTGRIALQVHGGGKTEACYKDINIIKL